LKKIKIILSIFTILIILSGCSNNEYEKLKNKVTEEINFLDNKIIDILNDLNNISLENYSLVYNKVELNEQTTDTVGDQKGSKNQESKENTQSDNENKQLSNIKTTDLKAETVLESNQEDIDWRLIKEKIENLNTSWSIILLDLNSINPDNTEILNFSNKLNETIISIENQNKIESLNNLKKLYEYIPKFLESSGLNNNEQIVKESKLYLVNAYVAVNEEIWDNVKNELINCETKFNDLTNDYEYIQNKEYKANKIFVLIKELENSIHLKDKKLFYIKYKNLLQSINSI